MKFWTINPSTEEKIREYESYTLVTLENKIKDTYKSFLNWKGTTFQYRAELMLKAADVLKKNKHDYATLMALEMGKPFSQGISEIEKCAVCCEYYAQNAETFLTDIEYKTEMTKSYVTFTPLGIVLAVMPWNFPFWQVFRFAVPALMAGNAGMLKHSRNTVGCAVEIENVFRQAGFPENVFTNLIISHAEVKEKSKYIIEHPLIAAVTLTGSNYSGSFVAETAGRVIKKTVMELGGSDPYIILPDADLELTTQACAMGRLINSGQSCIAAKRFIVHESIHDKFTELLINKMSAFKVGNPLEEGVSVGPMARKDLQEGLHAQVMQSIKLGAIAELGCELPDGPGYFYPVSVLTNVKPGMPAFDEETFGPVASIISYKTEDEAIELSNNHIYGLGAAVFSQDINKAEYIARNLVESGTVQVNDFVRSDSRLPFGGIKQSGYGRELSDWGIREFVNVKTVSVR
ncbi:MAG: NAD-dependent succinate-semialdehyde dehydrogenase [bacterium]